MLDRRLARAHDAGQIEILIRFDNQVEVPRRPLHTGLAMWQVGRQYVAQFVGKRHGASMIAPVLAPIRGVWCLSYSVRGLVDLDGFEPSTSSMPWKRAPNCATGPSGVPELRPARGKPSVI
jgi:hypothetical protein